MSDWASPPPGLAETQHRIPAGPYLTFPAFEQTSVSPSGVSAMQEEV